jgi:hypothetical protein
MAPVEGPLCVEATGVCDEDEDPEFELAAVCTGDDRVEPELATDDTEDPVEEADVLAAALALSVLCACNCAAVLILYNPPLGPTTPSVVANPKSNSKELVPQHAFPLLSSL